MKPTLLFLSCEHAVNTVPAPYAHLFSSHQSVLQTHRGIDFGALYIAQQLQKTIGCEFTQATVTRLLVDCNRSATHPHCFSEFSNTLSDADKQVLLATYYVPYRQHTEAVIQKHIDDGYQVFHLSCHSFTPEFEGTIRNAGIGLLYDPRRHGEKEVARQWHGILSQQTEYRVRMNYPYRGTSNGFTTELRKKHSEKDYLGLELEVNQTLVLEKKDLETVAHALSTSLKELMQLL